MKRTITMFLALMLSYVSQAQLYNNGATLKINGATLTLVDTKLTNNGTIDATTGSTVHVKGTATIANSSIAGSGTTTLGNLTIDKSSNDAQIDQNIEITGDLTLTTGSLKLNAGNITFTSSGQIVGETATKRIYGTGGELIATVPLNAPTNANPANLGAIITSTANLGSTTVKRGNTIYTVSGSSIARYYDIYPTTNTGLNATLNFSYLDSELNGNAEANLNLWRSTNAGASWTDRGRTAINTTTNAITLSAIDAFSRWTAAVAGVLPVELLSFSGKNTEGGNLLTWETASEVNNKGFEIERHIGGSQQPTGDSWETMGFVAAKGKSATYTFTDDYRLSPVAYYRLRQLDNDGKFAYSKVISIAQTSKGKGLSIYPNPVSSHLTIENTDLSSGTHEGGAFQILNLLGQQVLTGKTAQRLDVSALPQGTYVLKVGTEQAKFIKQ